MFSIEWIPKTDEHNCWNQWALAESKWAARWAVWDFKHTLRRRERKRIKTRIREL